METLSAEALTTKKCLPCEGGVDPCPLDFSQRQLEQLPGWTLTADQKRIAKQWTATNFMEAMRFFNEVAKLAEGDGHHPDLHLVGYRNVTIELWTHAIDGLSENDFILAAKIDQLPIATR
jgi:4a-hydroxytetrahydrobiopterin dehydratase